MNGIIDIQNLNFFYENESKTLDGISVIFEKNKITGVFGPNGCGKTTLLKCISNIYKNYVGCIRINQQNLKNLDPRKTSKILSFVPQEHTISFPYMAYEMVLMGRNPKMGALSYPTDKDIKKCQKAMEMTETMDIAFKPYDNLSGGQRQLILIARAIAQETPVLILDEPTSALDFKNQINIWNILYNLKKKSKTVIVCTHDPNHILWFCDDVLVMKKGMVFKFGEVKEVMDISTLSFLYGDVCSINESGIFPKSKRLNDI